MYLLSYRIFYREKIYLYIIYFQLNYINYLVCVISKEKFDFLRVKKIQQIMLIDIREVKVIF